MGRLVAKESETLFYQGKTLLAAATFLSVNDFKGAIQVLLRTQELYLAYYVAKYFYPDALKEVALRLAERAERYFQVDICLQLLAEDVKDEWITSLFRNRLLRTGLAPRAQDQKAIDESNADSAF